MKTIGLLGGMSWESTVPYYQAINRVVGARLGVLHSARIVLFSVDFHEIEQLQHADRWDEAAEILKKKGLPFEWGGDFGAPDETALSEEFDRPIAVHRYPSKVKAFYMKPDPQRPEVALGVDVLAPEGYGEIIGGGQRLDDYDLLVQRIKDHNLPQEAFEWYLDLRRYGSVPHGGFGMGIERVVSWICGLDHLREAIPYPRMLYRIYP